MGTVPGRGPDALYPLVVSAREGNAAALADLLEAIRPLVLRTIRSRLGSAVARDAVAEDLTQEVLVRIREALGGCRAVQESQFRAWVFTIARNTVIDWRRRRSDESARRACPLSVQAVGSDEPPPGASGPEADLVLGRILMEAQAELSPGTQTVLRRRLVYGDSWREAGAVIGTTEGGAKRRFQRALARLREEVLKRVEALQDEELRESLLTRLGQSGREG